MHLRMFSCLATDLSEEHSAKSCVEELAGSVDSLRKGPSGFLNAYTQLLKILKSSPVFLCLSQFPFSLAPLHVYGFHFS